MTGWSAALTAVGLFMTATGTAYAVRMHRRNLARLILGYGFTKAQTVGMKPDPNTGEDEAQEFEVVLRNLSRHAIKVHEFSQKPIVVRLNTRVLEISAVTSRPKERVRPKIPIADGTRILIEPFSFCLNQVVRIRVKTAEVPRDMRVEADAPDVVVTKMRHRRP
jgi:hypothetical protein